MILLYKFALSVYLFLFELLAVVGVGVSGASDTLCFNTFYTIFN